VTTQIMKRDRGDKNMYEVGRLCIKLTGRDARKKGVIVDILDDIYVLIDGQTRRRKCNIKHLEPLDKVLKIKKGAKHSEVVSALKKEGINVLERKPKQRAETKGVSGPQKTKRVLREPKKTKKTKKRHIEEPVKEKTKKTKTSQSSKKSTKKK
jgi:large subunit ribosomal protein L14e